VTAPDISLIFETDNNQEHRRIQLAEVAQIWKSQTAADRILECLLVATRPISPEEERALAGLPYRWIVRPNTTYYVQKNIGIAESRGAYFALVDSDARPDPDWLEQALAAMKEAPPDVAIVTGRTRYDYGPFSKEVTIANFPFQHAHSYDVLTVGAGNSIFRGDLLRRFRFEGDAIRHGADSDLANRVQEAGYRVVYDPRLKLTHNYTDRLTDLWGNVGMKGHAFALYAAFRSQRLRHPLVDAIGRYRVLLARLLKLRRPMGIPLWRLPLSALFYLWYVVATGRGYALALRGKPAPASRL